LEGGPAFLPADFPENLIHLIAYLLLGMIEGFQGCPRWVDSNRAIEG
jgi:hypothetical protein